MKVITSMSRDWKAKRARQAKARRAKEKVRLDILMQGATATGASEELKKEYLIACQKRRAVLDYDKHRIATRREKLKAGIAAGNRSDLEKAKKVKKTKQLYYRESKVQGKERNWKAKQRSRNRFDMIKSKIQCEGKDINSRCVNFRRSKMTPLGAAVTYCDPEAVSYLLERKASPTKRCIYIHPNYNTIVSGSLERQI